MDDIAPNAAPSQARIQANRENAKKSTGQLAASQRKGSCPAARNKKLRNEPNPQWGTLPSREPGVIDLRSGKRPVATGVLTSVLNAQRLCFNHHREVQGVRLLR